MGSHVETFPYHDPEDESGLFAHLTQIMEEAPFCDVCGHITIRNGSVFKCLNCGNEVGRLEPCCLCGHNKNDRPYLRLQNRWCCYPCAQEIEQIVQLWKVKQIIEREEQSWNPT